MYKLDQRKNTIGYTVNRFKKTKKSTMQNFIQHRSFFYYSSTCFIQPQSSFFLFFSPSGFKTNFPIVLPLSMA